MGGQLGSLRPLATIEPQGLSPVTATPGWELLELAVDSGASETVIPEGAVAGRAIEPSEASRRGCTVRGRQRPHAPKPWPEDLCRVRPREKL